MVVKPSFGGPDVGANGVQKARPGARAKIPDIPAEICRNAVEQVFGGVYRGLMTNLQRVHSSVCCNSNQVRH